MLEALLKSNQTLRLLLYTFEIDLSNVAGRKLNKQKKWIAKSIGKHTRDSLLTKGYVEMLNQLSVLDLFSSATLDCLIPIDITSQ